MKHEPKREFERDIEALINRHSMENGSNTPDFILAAYLCACLKSFDDAQNANAFWHRPEEA